MTVLVSHQAVPPTFYNKIASMLTCTALTYFHLTFMALAMHCYFHIVLSVMRIAHLILGKRAMVWWFFTAVNTALTLFANFVTLVYMHTAQAAWRWLVSLLLCRSASLNYDSFFVKLLWNVCFLQSMSICFTNLHSSWRYSHARNNNKSACLSYECLHLIKCVKLNG